MRSVKGAATCRVAGGCVRGQIVASGVMQLVVFALALAAGCNMEALPITSDPLSIPST